MKDKEKEKTISLNKEKFDNFTKNVNENNIVKDEIEINDYTNNNHFIGEFNITNDLNNNKNE